MNARERGITSATGPEDVLRFWFGAPDSDPLASAAKWWKKDAAFDAEIRERFGDALERGVRGELADWRTTPRGRLALVILFDQFSRNMFRGTPRSFAQDSLAREIADEALAAGDEKVLGLVASGFLLMPLMHAEDLPAQRRCIAGFERLRDVCPHPDTKVRDDLEKSVKYAQRHATIIERFGRFPHRNDILGRPATKDEAAFLEEPGSSF